MRSFKKEAAFVRAARRKANLSQDYVAKKLGYVTPQFISNIERGLCGLPLNKIQAFCKITGASAKTYGSLKINWYIGEVNFNIKY